MRIGINAAFLNERPTGVGIFTKEVSARLCAIHDDTVIFASVPFVSDAGRCVKKTPEAIRGSMRFSNNLMRMIYDNTVLPVALRRCGVDVLFCPVFEFPLFRPRGLVVMVHDLHPLYFPEQFGWSAFHFKVWMRLLPRLADRITVPSQFVKGEVQRVLGVEDERIDVLYLGYDSALFKPRERSQKEDFLKRHRIRGPFILFVGSHFPYKNVETLVKSFLAVKYRMPHSLVIVGRKDLSSGPLIEDERVFYVDYARREDIAAFYSYADLLVHPSLFEGFGMTVLEAMACGTPVISSNGGSLPEVVGDAGILFDPRDERNLSELMLKVISDERLRREMAGKGLKRASMFSWDKTASGLLFSCEKAFKATRR